MIYLNRKQIILWSMLRVFFSDNILYTHYSREIYQICQNRSAELKSNIINDVNIEVLGSHRLKLVKKELLDCICKDILSHTIFDFKDTEQIYEFLLNNK